LIVDCLCRHHCRAAAALPTVVLPPMTPGCFRVAKLAAAAAALSPPPTPPRYRRCRCRHSRASAAAALSPSPPAALPPRSPRHHRHCQAAKLPPTSALLPPSPLR